MNEIYRLSWEMVLSQYLKEYCNADPMYYRNIVQTVPNSLIPDEHWKKVQKETDDPWDQYNTLKRWSEHDIQFTRNVKLEKMVSEPQWEEVTEFNGNL